MIPASPAKNGQFSPSTPSSSKDCVAATTAMLVERALVGRIRPTHVDIRKLSGAPISRGLYMAEAVIAANHYGVKLESQVGLNRTQTRDTIGNGRPAGGSIDCSVTVNTSRRTNSYTGNHMVYVHQYQYWPGGSRCECEKVATYAHGEFLVEDPGTTSAGYLWWSADLFYRAAEKRGNGLINLLVGPDTEGRTWTALAARDVRTEPSYSTGKKLGSTKAGVKYAGGRTENGGNWKREDGSFADQWVHIKYGQKWAWTTRLGL